MPPAYDLADLKEIVRRNHQIMRLRQDHALKKLAEKTAKAELEEAQDALNDYINGLDEEHPLFEPKRTEAAPDEPAQDLDGFLAEQMDAAEARRKEPLPDRVLHAEADAAEAATEPDWRSHPIHLLPEKQVSVSTQNALRNLGINTLGQLDDAVKTLDDQARFAKRAGIKPAVAERLFTALDACIGGKESPAPPRVNKKAFRAERAAAKAQTPSAESDLDTFLVYPSRKKTAAPLYTLKAEGLLLATRWAKQNFPDANPRVVPDDGTAARLALPVKATIRREPAVDPAAVEGDEGSTPVVPASDLDKYPTRPDARRPPEAQDSAARRRSAVAS